MTFDPDAMPPLMTVNETALVLNGMALSTVRMLCKEGTFHPRYGMPGGT